MKTGKKVLLGVSGAALLVAGSIAGTLAYLTSTEEVVNTFTIGKVDIDLTETEVDSSGTPVKNEETGEIQRTETGNEYHLVPGAKYVKDPMITVKAESEEAYVRMLVTINNYEAFTEVLGVDIFDGVSNEWTTDADWLDVSEDGTVATLQFRYPNPVDGFDDDGKATEKELPKLFTGLNIPETLNGDDLNTLYTGNEETDFKITVVGHAIQSIGFTDDDAAWTAFDAQENAAEATE